MGILVYSLYWVMQDFVHRPKDPKRGRKFDTNIRVAWGDSGGSSSEFAWVLGFRVEGLGFRV